MGCLEWFLVGLLAGAVGMWTLHMLFLRALISNVCNELQNIRRQMAYQDEPARRTRDMFGG